MADNLAYPSYRTVDPGVYHDVFDGEHFAQLKASNVMWEGIQYPDKYFSSSTDMAFQLGLDGIQCFVRNGLDCWPIIITLFSLNPELRHRQEYQICCGIIAGKCCGQSWDWTKANRSLV
jgi:hypothetical protein